MRTAKTTGSPPIVKRNCIAGGGISIEPNFENNAQGPQQAKQNTVHQNHLDPAVSFNAIFAMSVKILNDYEQTP
jgi:hypothetical protein